MHLQHACWRRLTAKHQWYKATEAILWPHRSREEIRKLYSAALDETGIRLFPVPEEWWDHGLDRALIELERPPWQEGEVERLIAKYGRESFADLDL